MTGLISFYMLSNNNAASTLSGNALQSQRSESNGIFDGLLTQLEQHIANAQLNRSTHSSENTADHTYDSDGLVIPVFDQSLAQTGTIGLEAFLSQIQGAVQNSALLNDVSHPELANLNQQNLELASDILNDSSALQSNSQAVAQIIDNISNMLQIIEGQSRNATNQNAGQEQLIGLLSSADTLTFFSIQNITSESLTDAKNLIDSIAQKINNGEDPDPEELQALNAMFSGFVIMSPLPETGIQTAYSTENLSLLSQALLNASSRNDNAAHANTQNAPSPSAATTSTETADGSSSVPSSEIAAKLNNITAEEQSTLNNTKDGKMALSPSITGDSATSQTALPEARFALPNASQPTTDGLQQSTTTNPAGNIETARANQDISGKVAHDNATPQTNNAATQTSQPSNTISNDALNFNGIFSSTGSFGDTLAEQLGLSLTGAGSSSTYGSTTSVINHAQSATQAHQATQLVAATMQKAGKAGTDTNITLRLDPPELGRLDIQMQFHKDKTVKAVVTAEKPETFMMMQRDSQALERALQNAGLDPSDGGLSFELAQDGTFFDQHNQRGGGHHHGGTGSHGSSTGIDNNQDTIETTMSWYVDSDTGHTHYSLLA